MITSERRTYNGRQQIHIYGNRGVKLMVEVENGHITHAFVAADRQGTFDLGCIGMPTLGSLRRLFALLAGNKLRAAA